MAMSRSFEVRQHNETILSCLKEGDLIEFNRGHYSHWAVYIGEEQVVHLTGDENDGINGVIKPDHVFTISGVSFNKAKVTVQNFWDVTLGTKAKINNAKDRKCSPFTPEEIVEKALSMVGDIGYNVLWNNCEHFAAFCRYGKKWSEQADAVLSWMAGIITGVAALGIAYGLTKDSNKKKEEKPSKS